MSRQQSKSKRGQLPAPLTTSQAVERCAEAQDHLIRAQALSKQWEQHRRDAVRQAFEAGATTQELAAALNISRAKIYQLIGSARALKA